MNEQFPHISAKSVRYIKLGEAGRWEKSSIRDGVLRFGFESGEPLSMAMCLEGRWDDLARSWREDGAKSASTARRFTNETRQFFQADPEDLWITFVGERLYWGFLEPGSPVKSDDDASSWRRVAGGWRCTDRNGTPLVKSNLPGGITKLAAYRGTSCGVDVDQQVIRRINAEVEPQVATARNAVAALETALVPLLQRLGPRDLEVLVELIFSASGWRRLDTTGGTRKLVDLDLELPTTQERAFVQVKTGTNQNELQSYIDLMQQESFGRMFYVYHSGTLHTDQDNVTLIGPMKLANMVLNAGLTDWVMRKVE